MRNRKSLTAVAVLVALAALPWPAERWRADRSRRQDARNDELFALYDCFPVQECAADFDGDGAADRLDVAGVGRDFDGSLVALVGGREVLRLPYSSTDNTLRTHAAVRDEAGRSRLLIFDGASYRPGKPLRAAFAWDGGRLAEVTPGDLDREILTAMAARDDTGGWHERVFRDIMRAVRLSAYYVLLFVLFALAVRRLGRGGGGVRSHSFRG